MKQILMTVVVVALLATTAVAQDIETTMAGGASIGAGLVSEAWLQNPAVLGMQAAVGPVGEGDWRHSAAGLIEFDGDTDLKTLSWGGHLAGARWGVGAGVVDASGMDSIGLGFGYGEANGRLAAGVNYQHVDIAGASSVDVFDFAVGGLLPEISERFTRATWGIVARDISDEIQTTVDLGFGMESAQWRVAADLLDITDEVNTVFQIGASHSFGEMQQWRAGAGLNDGDITAGIVYRVTADDGVSPWKIGLAWVEGDNGSDSWLIGAGADW